MGKTKKKIQVPQILVLIMLLILVFCALSYIVPGGEFQLDDNKRAIAGTFQFVGQNPVSPWQALLSIKKGIVGSASTISLLLICGGSLAVVISTGCFEEMINYGIYRLEDKSVIVLVPAIVTLMSLLGAFAGNDSMIAFVTVGLVICSRLKLDRICAMSMFYLGYLIGQGASFTSTLLITVQSICEVTPLSGMQVRIIIWIIFTAIHAAYCTHYALKITKNPLRSITGVLTKPEEQGEKKETKFPIRAFVNMITLFSCYIPIFDSQIYQNTAESLILPGFFSGAFSFYYIVFFLNQIWMIDFYDFSRDCLLSFWISFIFLLVRNS